MQTPKRILICPLDWGLGHATRCIPIIRLLLKKNTTVIIAASGRPLHLLKQEFPELEFIVFEGYNIQYPKEGLMAMKMLTSIPKILLGIAKEHKALKQIVKENQIDIVISDSRFGLYSNAIKSIFITHQLMIKSPFGENILRKINLRFINKYNEIWIADAEGNNNLSGDLSHKHSLPKNTFFIGILSRFTKNADASKQSTSRYNIGDKGEQILAIISGPEPQRTIFEKIIVRQLLQTNCKAIVVSGKTELPQTTETINNIEIITHLPANEMEEIIRHSTIIIARSGYSTIMDLAVLGKKAIFIPTPGQTEQEYLAKLLKKKKIAFFQKQSQFNLQQALIESESYTGFNAQAITTELEKRIDLLLQ